MPNPILFYFDFASPYGYLASQRIDAFAARFARTVDWRAILIGPAMKETGAQPQTAVPLRAAYAREDLPRLAKLWGIKFTEPPGMPIFALQAGRAFWWAHEAEGPDAARRLALALYAAHFGRGEDIASADGVLDVAESAGFARDAVAAGLGDPAVKERLKEESAASLRRGVFGSPWFVMDAQNFWGVDRLYVMEEILKRQMAPEGDRGPAGM